MQLNPVSCKQSIAYAYRGQTRWQKCTGWSFLFPRSHIRALGKQINFHLNVWMLKWHFSPKCVYFHVQLKTSPCSDTCLGDWEILVILLCQKVTSRVRCVWYMLVYFVFFLSAIYLCETKLKSKDHTGISGEGIPRDRGCVVLDSPGLLPTLHLCETFLLWFVPALVPQLCSYCVLSCLVDWRTNIR